MVENMSEARGEAGSNVPNRHEEGSLPITYAQAGVDIEEGARAVDGIKDSVRSTYRREVIGDIGGFGALFSIAAARDMKDPILVSGTDGVGTKLQLAQLAQVHTSIGIDLVAMCVNDILATGAEPLFFLDYIAIGKLDSEQVGQIVAGIAEGCRQAGCALIGGEMAEHPGLMAPDEYDVSGFCVGLVDRDSMLEPNSVKEGDVLIGLASSGLHSNGYSLARKVCTEGKEIDEISRPCDTLDGLSVLEALLKPTRIYVASIQKLINDYPGAVRSLAHITGGGITENLNRALPENLDAQIELGSWELPPIVRYVCEQAHLDEKEALKTFNMGLGMILLVDPNRSDEVLRLLRDLGEDARIIGSVTTGTGEVAYRNQGALKL